MVEEPDNRISPDQPVGRDGDGGDADADRPAGGEDSGTELTVEPGAEEFQSPALNYPVVGVGASAGGLQAFRQLLENLDPNTGMAYVLVTHMAPDQKSFLTEILERYTHMLVKAVEDGERPLPNHLYVLRPNQALTLREGVFHVEEPVTERFSKLIDKFFYSLAADQRNHAIGVVLSGADGDGALGLKAIKGESGIALVQSPESATHSGMPRSSIASDHVDLVVPPAELAAELERLAQQFTRREVRSLDEGSPDEEQAYQRILQLLRTVSGLDLRTYKPETIRRRISRRMLLLRIDRMKDYLRFLQMRQDELRSLQADVLIGVTRFFRDVGFWNSLRENVLPVLMKDRPQEKPVRVWCAGCSTGEEVYSLAMILLEYFSEHDLETPLQIFGTDISDQAIETARIANYPETLMEDVSPERLRRFFVKTDRGHQVSKRVRDLCIFARQNLCSDPPFSHLDILSCRNVMIYFDQALQRQVIQTFHYALDPGGYILLGMSEGLLNYAETFSAVDRRHKIYMKTGASLPYEPPRSFAMSPAPRSSPPALAEMDNNLWPELELQRAADRIVLARFGPPGLIVDDSLTVLQARGQISQFLDIAPGTVTWNLLRVVKNGLLTTVSEAAQRAIRDNEPESASVLLIDEKTGEYSVHIDVLPITSAVARARCFLILFQSMPTGREQAAQAAPVQLTADEKDRLIAQLRQDLIATRFHLNSLVEERDARNQELASANHDIQSANEELQSTNEELETTKEELQSTNEELQTVNDELQQRNSNLIQTGNDLNNLLNSVNIPLLMLDADLKIRQFTPPMQRLLNVRQSDMGRSISEIRLQLSIEDIEPILHEVLESLGTREMEVQDREGRWQLLRVRPYRTAENKIEGLVVVLMEIDELRRSQQSVMDARDFARAVVESVPVPIVVMNADLTVRTVNSSFRDLTGISEKELEGRALSGMARRMWGLKSLNERVQPLLNSEAGKILAFEHQVPGESSQSLAIRIQVLETDGTRVLLMMVEDVTLRREAERLIAQQKKVLESTQEELRSLTGHLFVVQEEERQRVARELHDDVSQRLSLLEMLLHQIDGQDGKESIEKLEKARKQISVLNNDVRQISHRLHPAILSDLGLAVALQALVKEFGERENMPATYLSEDLPESWPPEAATAIYRIAQEALRNVSKHAGKTHVKVVLSGRNGGLQLKVMDFGIGFDQEAEIPAPGLGMISMQERARLAGGTLTVQSALGQGTTVTIEIPLEGGSSRKGPHA